MLFAVHAFPMEGRLANIHVRPEVCVHPELSSSPKPRYSLPEGAQECYSQALLSTLTAPGAQSRVAAIILANKM